MRTLLHETRPIDADLRRTLQSLSSHLFATADRAVAVEQCEAESFDLLVHSGSVAALQSLCGPLRETAGCGAVAVLALLDRRELSALLDVSRLDPCDFVLLPVTPAELSVRARLLVRQVRTPSVRAFSRVSDDAARDLEEVERLVRLGSWAWLPRLDSVRWSKELYRIFGLEPERFPATLDGYLDRVHPEDRERTRRTILRSMETGEPFAHEERIVRDDGTMGWLRSRGLVERDEDGKARRMFGTCQDITEQKALEQQLVQSQKMESLGRLAGGIAHDFNNLLSVILTFGGILAGDEALAAGARDAAGEILRAAERAAGLTRRLLDFSRRRSGSLHSVDVDEVCEGLCPMLGRLLGDVELQTELSARPWRALLDPGQLEQVVVNLVLNARDAMDDGGEVRIVTERCSLDRGPPSVPELEPGDYVHLRVSDDGRGIDEAILEQIFEPFFTTKERGSGTGLGLAIVHAFAKSHGGAVHAESAVGRGTTVHLWLPRSEAPSRRGARRAPSDRVSCPTPGTILVVEDEPQVRATLAAILERAGCDVVTAGGVEEALSLLERRGGDLALLITDVVMPAGGGRRIVESLRGSHPSLPVLFLSGHPDDALVVEDGRGRPIPFLEKPFTAEALLEQVREIVGVRAAPEAEGEPEPG